LKGSETMKTKLMTKLALAAAVVCAVVGARADIMKWTIDGVYDSSDKAASDNNPYTAYYFYIVGSVPSADVLASTKTTIQSLIENRDTSSWDNNSTKYLRSASSTSGGFEGQFTTFENVTTFAVVLNAFSLNSATQYMLAKTESGSYYATATGNSSDHTKIKTISFGNQKTNGAVWQTIPEPTSGILLALGVAALALKRKHAA